MIRRVSNIFPNFVSFPLTAWFIFFSISHSTLQSTYKIALCTGRLLCNVPLSLWIYPGHYFSIFSNCSVFIEFDDDNHHLEPHGCTPMQYWNRPPTPYTNGSGGCWSFGAFRPFSLLQTTGMNLRLSDWKFNYDVHQPKYGKVNCLSQEEKR